MGWRYTGTAGNDTINSEGFFVSPGVFQQNIIETDNLTDEMFGGGGNDSLSGRSGTDSLNGQAGNDTLIGGTGNDTLEGGSNNDLLEGQLGADSMNGGFGIDTVSYFDNAGVTVLLYLGQATDAGGSVDTLLEFENVNGSNSADVIVGNAGGNSLAGFGGNDLLEGQGGPDTLDGGLGVDTASYFDAGAATVRLDLGSATDSGGSADTLLNIENVNGSNAADVIVGNAGANSLAGLGGDDLLEGQGGPDTIDGGFGVDTVSYFDAGAVDVRLDLGSATDSGGSADSLLNIENVNGSNAADTIVGTTGANLIQGLDGNDIVDGNGGGDTLLGGDGADVLYGRDGADSLDGGDVSDTLYLYGVDGDTVEGGGGEDVLAIFTNIASYGVTLTMAAGATPWVVRVAGVVQATIANVEGLAFAGGAPRDVVNATAATSNCNMQGGGGNDVLRGGALNDVLNGQAGNDQLFGNAGQDFLVGEGGRDTMNGGSGPDTYGWNLAGEGNDSIIGFETGSDRLQIDASGFKGGLTAGIDLLATGRFVAGAAPTAAKGQFLYDIGAGLLQWDRDGTGAAAAVTIASFGAGTVVAAGDFVVVA